MVDYLIEMKKTGLTIEIQNLILTLDCQSQSNPQNWIAIRIEQSSNPIKQYPGYNTFEKINCQAKQYGRVGPD